jgi:hypothetical protein
LYTVATPDGRPTFRTASSPRTDNPRTVRFPNLSTEHPLFSSPLVSPASVTSSTSCISPPTDEWIEIRPGEFLNPKTTFDSIDVAQSGDLRYVPNHTLTGGVINLLDPWKGYRNGHLVLCFPVELPRQFFSLTDYFDNHFSFRQSLQDTEKFYPNFLRRFPSFHKYNNGLDFYNQVVIYCHGVGIFCPPLHTLSPTCVYGTWYRQIPQGILDNLLHHDEFLKSALSNTPTGLTASTIANVASTVSDLTISGYKMIRRLLTAFGHPKFPLWTPCPSLPQSNAATLRWNNTPNFGVFTYTSKHSIIKSILTVVSCTSSYRAFTHHVRVCSASMYAPLLLLFHHTTLSPVHFNRLPSTLTSTRFVFNLVACRSSAALMVPLALVLPLAPP